MKRFYKQVAIYKDGDLYGIYLDGKPVKTQAGKVLLCSSEKLAKEVGAEWDAQEKDILPSTMPVTKIVITTLDQTRSRDEILRHIDSYIETDLVFFRADASPYREKQEMCWGKFVQWYEKKFSVSLNITEQITPLRQDEKLRKTIADYCKSLCDISLTLYDSVLEDTSSNILTSALFEAAATPEEIYEAVFLDDLIRAVIYDEERYGAAPDQEKKRRDVRRNLEGATRLLAALKS